MSPNLKWTFVIGNGVLAVVAGLIALVSIGKYGVFPFVVETAVCALAVFNIRIILWAARLTSEEEWLKAEVRKAELRHRLADLGQFASALVQLLGQILCIPAQPKSASGQRSQVVTPQVRHAAQ